MDRSKARKLVAAGCALAVVGVAIALASPSIGDAPPASDTPGSCVDFARDVNPKEVAVDSGYDPEKDLVYAHQGSRTYVLRPSDPACRTLSGPSDVIEDAVRTDQENVAVMCRQLSEAVADGRSEVGGRAFDREAASRYVEQRCGGAK
ncbi:MAG: hypothetical protein WEB06_09920 [Actinomycetota bacterium]